MWRHPNELHDSIRQNDDHIAVLRPSGVEVVHVSCAPRHEASYCEAPSWWWANLRDLGLVQVSPTHLAPYSVSPLSGRFLVVKCPECDAIVPRHRSACDLCGEPVTHPAMLVCEECVKHAASV